MPDELSNSCQFRGESEKTFQGPCDLSRWMDRYWVAPTHVTERMKLECSQHWELICFIVVPKMMEEVILGLTWLDKWGPTIWWWGLSIPVYRGRPQPTAK